MARGIVAVCIGGLLTVSVVGFSLPYGGLLSDRDLDALVGGTGSGWCLECPFCAGTLLCNEVPDSCKDLNPGDPCNPVTSNFSASPETCSTKYGNQLCDTSATPVNVVCKVEYACDCQEVGDGPLTCTADDSSQKEYKTSITKDLVVLCGAGTPSSAIEYQSCD
ncbi:MAG: hypothetical protein HQ582_34620 [Planctomycetes bacterium]|nr:hypothetical protein [Planctomycetota bacterium]